MFRCLHHRAWHYLLLTALGWCLFFINLGGPSLWDLDEGRNTTCAFEMMEADNWVIPTFNGDLRVDKPALLYWLQIAAYHCFGITEFAARLPSALAALATVFLCYELGRSMFSPVAGLLAAVIAASTPMLCGAARFANPDALLDFFVVLTLTIFWIGRERPGLWWFAALGTAQGLGVLSKGPVALVLPAGIIFAFLFWERRLTLLADSRLAAGAIAFLLVAAPWYVRVTAETKGDFARGFFLTHNVARFTSTMENHRGGIWYYPLVIVLGTMPWSIFVLPALWYGMWSAASRPLSRWQAWWAGAAECAESDAVPEATVWVRADRVAAYRLLLCWIALFLIFFTLSATKLPNYALPVVVPSAIVIARFLDRWRLERLRIAGRILALSLVCLVLLGVGLGMGLLIAGGAVPIDVTRGRSLHGLAPWALLGLVPIGGAIAGGWCLRTGKRAALILSVALSAVLLLVPLGAYGVEMLEAHRSPRALVQEAGARDREHDIRVVAWGLDHLPSLNFYVERRVEYCITESQVITYVDYPLPVFVFLSASRWEQLQPMLNRPCRELARHPDLYRGDDVVVVTNR
jgi:4-amino-4-deoxy-L-arabinose transferase-like glycosyltransferase